MALYSVYPDKRYLDYALAWGEKHYWKIRNGGSTQNADHQCAGQTYIALYELTGNAAYIAEISENIQRMVDSNTTEAWWWVDALHMAMPVFAKLGVIKNDHRYFEKMYALYNHTKNIEGGHGLYAANTHYNLGDSLWWRDKKYQPPVVNKNGKPVYWSRGNGWAFAAHVRVLDVLPKSDPHYDEYVLTFLDMAKTLVRIQQPDGFWYVNLGDPADFGGPEISGTGFFTYGIAWGINNGYLDRETFLPAAKKAWEAMVDTAVMPNGFLGYVQKIGSTPGMVYSNVSHDFGVGAFLLAGSEMVKLADGMMPQPKESGN